MHCTLRRKRRGIQRNGEHGYFDLRDRKDKWKRGANPFRVAKLTTVIGFLKPYCRHKKKVVIPHVQPNQCGLAHVRLAMPSDNCIGWTTTNRHRLYTSTYSVAIDCKWPWRNSHFQETTTPKLHPGKPFVASVKTLWCFHPASQIKFLTDIP